MLVILIAPRLNKGTDTILFPSWNFMASFRVNFAFLYLNHNLCLNPNFDRTMSSNNFGFQRNSGYRVVKRIVICSVPESLVTVLYAYAKHILGSSYEQESLQPSGASRRALGHAKPPLHFMQESSSEVKRPKCTVCNLPISTPEL